MLRAEPRRAITGRRLVLALVVAGLLATVALRHNPKAPPGAPPRPALVGIAKAATDLPDEAQIEQAVHRAVALAGGLPRKIGPGAKIVIQPNLVQAGWPSGSGVITDARVVRTVIRMCLRQGAAPRDITICEGTAVSSSGTGVYSPRQVTRKALVDSGLDPDGDMMVEGPGGVHIARCVDANYAGDYHGPGGVHGAYPDYPDYSGPYDARFVTRVSISRPLIDRVYVVPKCAAECDVLIRVPVLKNHHLAGVTGALKLAFGLAPNDIYHAPRTPLYKWSLLHNAGTWGRVEEDSNARGMVDMTLCRKPDFVVLDGLVGVINGPVGGEKGADGPPSYPREGKMRCIIAGSDPVAVDTVLSLACGYDPASILALRYASERGLGATDPAYITVAGASVRGIRRRFPAWGCAEPGEWDPPRLRDLRVRKAEDGSKLTIEPVGWGDSGSGVCKAELLVDGRLVATSRKPPYGVSLRTADATPGRHVIDYVLYDRMLNQTAIRCRITIAGPALP